MECFVVGNFNESINEIKFISDFPRADELGCRGALYHLMCLLFTEIYKRGL
jgi:hypothetical protein